MKLPLALGWSLMMPLLAFSQVLVLQNGHKFREFWEGDHVEIWTCTSCDPSILNDCVGNYDLFGGVLQKVKGDSLTILVNNIKKYRMLQGSSALRENRQLGKNPQLVYLDKKRIDLIHRSSPPRLENFRRTGAFVGCVLLTIGVGEYLTTITDADTRLSDKAKTLRPNAAIVLGALGLGQFYRKKYYLTPLLKGSDSKQVWNVK